MRTNATVGIPPRSSRNPPESPPRKDSAAAKRAKSQFLATMSHELRTPLNAVLGLSEALLEGAFGALGHGQTTPLQTIHDSGRHLLALIKDVLDVARIEAGTLLLQRTDTDLGRLISESVTLVEILATEKHQTILTTLASPLPVCKVDSRRIKQVLINLLTNAIKFTPRGGEIRVVAATRGRFLELIVADTGPGIAHADRDRIFEPFVTFDPVEDHTATTRRQEGAGFGLALVRNLVELHHGHVRVISGEGEGATFGVRLPLVAAPLDTRGTVLLADVTRARAAIADQLRRRGIHTIEAVGRAEVIEQALEPHIALIVLRLPFLDALSVTLEVRARANGTPKPIVLVGDEHDARLAQLAGVTRHVRSDASIEELSAVLGSLHGAAELE